MVGLLLDRRSHASSRAHENAQFLMSRDRIFQLGGKAIPSEEIEMLLSITTYDETLVPQCIRYFQHHFFRLKDPRFQSLLEAFLCTRADNGRAVLANVMREPNNHVAEQLITFLEDGIKTCTCFHVFRSGISID